ncbi:hypothetical protein Y032_0013g2020 [Ancylostoma ceylanicum]|uniref:Uncharacterized protein n=1 Tax=Ancylostoma ceylanicum TaxID=53326 RepID=A0A016VBK7_9BILA|nr:hypothetical protein Y032_0013g2020 [Ancylostoma ceylanicum]
MTVANGIRKGAIRDGYGHDPTVVERRTEGNKGFNISAEESSAQRSLKKATDVVETAANNMRDKLNQASRGGFEDNTKPYCWS